MLISLSWQLIANVGFVFHLLLLLSLQKESGHIRARPRVVSCSSIVSIYTLLSLYNLDISILIGESSANDGDDVVEIAPPSDLGILVPSLGKIMPAGKTQPEKYALSKNVPAKSTKGKSISGIEIAFKNKTAAKSSKSSSASQQATPLSSSTPLKGAF